VSQQPPVMPKMDGPVRAVRHHCLVTGRDLVAEALASGDVDAVVSLGCELSEGGDHINAAHCFQWAIAQGAEWVTLNLGNELVSLDRDGEAIAMYQRTARVGETDAWFNLGQAGAELYPSARAALADLLHDCGRLLEAVQVLQPGTSLGECESFLPLANLYLDDLDDATAAEAIYRAGIDAGDIYCHHNLAELLAKRNRLDEAIHHYQRAAAAGDALAAQALTQLSAGGAQDE
jgi:tetratricopeptide (TPR) repeat protein